jgi:hypothetical protein
MDIDNSEVINFFGLFVPVTFVVAVLAYLAYWLRKDSKE